MKKKIIKNINIILEDKILQNGSLVFSDKIEKISAYNLTKERDMEEIDGKGGYLSAGLIDTHIHGAGGYDTMDADSDSLNNISKVLARYGVTSFLPTTMTMSSKDIQAALENIRAAKINGTDGARVVGTHVEGPFISPEYIGAQNSDYLAKPNRELLRNYYDVIKVVTLAPEVEGALELIEDLTENNITASAGHSAASYEDFKKAFHLGMDHFTHLYNAMTGLHHRNPGLVGAALDFDTTVELIADLIHHHPAVDRLTINAKGADKVILVSDAMEAAGLEEGEYELGGQKVIVKDGAARLEDGRLAGSVLTLDKAVRNLLEISRMSIPDLFKMVTVNPAEIISLDHQLGRIREDLKADLAIFNEEFEVEKTFKAGKLIYSKKA